jgi:hypothetical protein
MVPHGTLLIWVLDLHGVGGRFRQYQEEEGIVRSRGGRRPRLVLVGQGGGQRLSSAEEEERGPPRRGGSLVGLVANVGWFKVQQSPSLGCQDMGRWRVVAIFLRYFHYIFPKWLG